MKTKKYYKELYEKMRDKYLNIVNENADLSLENSKIREAYLYLIKENRELTEENIRLIKENKTKKQDIIIIIEKEVNKMACGKGGRKK